MNTKEQAIILTPDAEASLSAAVAGVIEQGMKDDFKVEQDEPMTVAQLIEALQKFPMDAIVVDYVDDWNGHFPIGLVKLAAFQPPIKAGREAEAMAGKQVVEVG